MTHIEFDARRGISIFLVFLVGCELFLVFADVVFNVGALIDLGPIRRFFNMAREDGVASWFAITQTWMVGLTASFIYFVARADDSDRWRTIGWAVIALFLLYWAMDDGAKVHERIGSSVKHIILGANAESRQIGFFPSYTWQLVFLPIFGSFGLFLLWFLNRELQHVRHKLMVVAAIGFLVLAVTADFFEGLEPQHPLNLHSWISATMQWEFAAVVHYSKTIEEFMEMLAMTFLWIVFLRHLVSVAPEIHLRFRK